MVPHKPAHCNVLQCNKPVYHSNGLCAAHHMRLLRHGSPTGGNTPKGALPKFLSKAIAYDGNDCLFWPFANNGDGYGLLKVGGKPKLAHRIVCEAIRGKPNDGDFAIHSCGRGHLGCITPAHLRWGTRADNASDAVLHGATARGERHAEAKLTEQDVTVIRRLAGSLSQQKLANRFGVGKTAIANVINRKTWAWLA